jgi:hypothetical protein
MIRKKQNMTFDNSLSLNFHSSKHCFFPVRFSQGLLTEGEEEEGEGRIEKGGLEGLGH